MKYSAPRSMKYLASLDMKIHARSALHCAATSYSAGILHKSDRIYFIGRPQGRPRGDPIFFYLGDLYRPRVFAIIILSIAKTPRNGHGRRGAGAFAAHGEGQGRQMDENEKRSGAAGVIIGDDEKRSGAAGAKGLKYVK